VIEISPEIVTIIFAVAILIGVLWGYPIGLVVGGSALVIGLLTLGPLTFALIYRRVFFISMNYTFLALPLFIFMGAILERSGVADGLYSALHVLLGRFRGGLAVSTVLVGTVLAACLGVIAASVSILTILGLAAMVKRGYDKSLASGSICAGGTLGILIPPSVMLVVMGPMANISVGKLFMGAFFPGFLLSGLYCTYITIRSFLQPNIAPVISAEEVRAIPLAKKLTMLFTSLIPPVFLILAVLGSIFFGIAPPTEAAAIGAAASVLLSVAYRKFNWETLKRAALETFRITGFVMLIGYLSYAMVGIFMRLGCANVIEELLLAAPGGRWGTFAVVMFIIFTLGMFIDWIGIAFIVVPIIIPIAPALGFDPLWFTMMICVNLQMAFMTPPFAMAIFVCRGTAPSELGVTTNDIIKGVTPFVILIMIGLIICVIFPEIILWLPSKMVTTGWN
jgi:tripartite ATP-independent transporter DctM subunit